MKRIPKIRERKISGVFEIETEALKDDRGSLAQFYNKNLFGSFGISAGWVTEYLSYNLKKHTLRGLNVSLPPTSESKMILATAGTVQWVVTDLRRGSKTFGKWDALTLSAETYNVLLVGRGFAHGCLSLTDNAKLLIKADNYFSGEKSTGIIWNDPDLAILWNLKGGSPIVSAAHQKYGSFKDFVRDTGGLDV